LPLDGLVRTFAPRVITVGVLVDAAGTGAVDVDAG
jgi:hypothetical protein